MAERSIGFYATATFTPAAAAYSAGDIIEGKKEFTGFGPMLGGIIEVRATTFLVSETALQSGETSYNLHFYSITPPSNLADNAAFAIPSGDRASYLGFVSLGTPVAKTNSLWVEQGSVGKYLYVPASAAGGSVFGYLETVGGATLTATARKVTIFNVTL